MQHLLHENIGLLTCRQIASNKFQHAFVTNEITDNCSISLTTKERTYFFPLYLYPTEEKKKKSLQSMMVFELDAAYGKGKRPNIAGKVFESLQTTYNKKPTPEHILYYCYAVLYSNIYREKYAPFLKIDFPRIPFTANYQLFLQAATLGGQLTDLHLLKHKSLNHPSTKYYGRGDNDKVVKPVYNPAEQKVYINESRYFDNVTAEVWNYNIGGYQVMEKYLKDRKGRQMDDPAHYCKMATAIAKTIELQKEIDVVFLDIEKVVIK
jgi:predicted helicase